MLAEPAASASVSSGPGQPDRFGSVQAASTSGFHKVAYTDWGPIDSESVVICVHGLTRQGRDFDYLAADLARAGHRVICPDLVGRGRSDWLRNGMDYVFPQYCADMVTLLATVRPATVSWVGSSLGGLIGIVLAGLPGSPIARLVVNDIGPDVPFVAAMRVGQLLGGLQMQFATIEEADAYFRRVFTTYGDLSDENWRHIATHSVAWNPDRNRFVARLDPKVVPAFQLFLYYQMTLWNYWDSAPAKKMCIRGRDSDFMPWHLVSELQRRTPGLELVEMRGVGHMPMLMSPPEIAAIRGFLGR